MEWYWVIIMCFIASSIGLLIGCMCRVAGRADKRAGLKAIEYKATGGIYEPGTLVYYQDCQEDDQAPVMIKEPMINMAENYSESRMASVLAKPRDTAKSAINLISMLYKSKGKKFRWKNYYKALKFMGRVANGRKRTEGSQYTETN